MAQEALQELEEAQRRVCALQADLHACAAASSQLGSRLALVRAYRTRIDDVCAVFEGYSAALGDALAQLGAAASGGGQPARDRQGQLARALQGCRGALCRAGVEPLSLDRLLDDAQAQEPLPAGAVPATTVLMALEGDMRADLAEVQSWGSQGSGSARRALADDPEACAIADAIASLRKLHVARYRSCRQAEARQQAELERRVADARAALASSAAAVGEGPQATLRALAAQQAGLQAAIRQSEALARPPAAAPGGQQALADQLEEVGAMQEREQQLDARIAHLSAANVELALQWRKCAWQARDAVQSRLEAQGPVLRALAEQLAAAMQAELEAFQATPWPPRREQEEGRQGGTGSMGSCAGAAAAAEPLDPLAGTKTPEHATKLLAAAASELAALQPVRAQWRELVEAAEAHADKLQAAAAGLEAQLGELQEEGAGAAMQQLAEAEAAAAAGVAAVADTRGALAEWWASPALHAVPWIKHGGRNVSEWLRRLGELEDAERRRKALGDLDTNQQGSLLALA
eukprot:scaffold3.g6364.t1